MNEYVYVLDIESDFVKAYEKRHPNHDLPEEIIIKANSREIADEYFSKLDLLVDERLKYMYRLD